MKKPTSTEQTIINETLGTREQHSVRFETENGDDEPRDQAREESQQLQRYYSEN